MGVGGGREAGSEMGCGHPSSSAEKECKTVVFEGEVPQEVTRPGEQGSRGAAIMAMPYCVLQCFPRDNQCSAGPAWAGTGTGSVIGSPSTEPVCWCVVSLTKYQVLKGARDSRWPILRGGLGVRKGCAGARWGLRLCLPTWSQEAHSSPPLTDAQGYVSRRRVS